MDLWYPPDDEPALLEWFRPLLLASAAGRAARCSWPIHFEEFMLMGRYDRASRPAIWVYKHKEARRQLYLDDAGKPYTYTPTPNAKSHGRFNQCDIRTAIWHAELPRFVDAIWFDDPGPTPAPTPAPSPERPHHELPPSSAGRRRGHLTVIDGGRSLAG